MKKPTPHIIKVMNAQKVIQSTTTRQQAADRFRQRQLDAALKRLLRHPDQATPQD